MGLLEKWGSGGGVAPCPPPGPYNRHGRAGKGEEFKGEVCARTLENLEAKVSAWRRT